MTLEGRNETDTHSSKRQSIQSGCFVTYSRFHRVPWEPFITLGSQKRNLNFCIRGTPPRRLKHTQQVVIFRLRTGHCLFLAHLPRLWRQRVWLNPTVPEGSRSRGGDVTVISDINQPSLPTHFYPVLVSISVVIVLSTVFHSINSPDNSPFSHSVLSVLSLPYWSFQTIYIYISHYESLLQP